MTPADPGVDRLRVNAPLVLRAALELDVLDRIRNIHRLAVDPRLIERGVEERGRPREAGEALRAGGWSIP